MLEYIPKLGLDFSGLVNLNLNTHYAISHFIDFRSIVKTIVNAHKVQEETNKLGIHLDPWDNYLYHDSKLFLDFVFNKNFYSTQDKFVFMKFLVFVYYNDFLSNFKLDGKLLADKLFEFIKSNENDRIYNFLNRTLIEKIEPNEEQVDEFENGLEVLFDLFLQKLMESKIFSDKKNDYF
jgi:hypothetical protein